MPPTIPRPGAGEGGLHAGQGHHSQAPPHPPDIAAPDLDLKGEHPCQSPWRDMEQQIEDFMEKQRHSQQVINSLLREQMSFVKKMQFFTQMQAQSRGQKDHLPEQPGAFLAHAPLETPQLSEGDGSAHSEQQATEVSQQHRHNYNHLELAGTVHMDGFKETQSGHLVNLGGKNTMLNTLRARGGTILGSAYFEPAMGIAILANAINIGWAIDQELRGRDPHLAKLIENCFLALFTAEIGLRLFVRGWRCLKDFWNLMDFVLVFVTVVAQLLILLVDQSEDLDIESFLGVVLVLRIWRIMRLARAVRLVRSFKSLWRLVQGLMQSGITMLSAFMLMLGTTFLFGCFGAEFITKAFRNDPDIGPAIEAHFNTLPKILITLFQFITMDGISDFYMPLVFRQPLLTLYFLPLTLIVSIALMNLITALLVENAISNQRMDEEMMAFYTRRKLRVLEPLFRDLFRNFDISGDGVVKVDEVLEAMHMGSQIPKPLQDIVSHARIVDLFDALDKDQSGFVSEDEFVEGLGYMALSDVPLETLQILHIVRNCRKDIAQLTAQTQQSRQTRAAKTALLEY